MTMSDRFLGQRKPTLIGQVNRFLVNVVRSLPISIGDGRRSPIAKTFQLIIIMEDIVREKIESEAQRQTLKEEFQMILEVLVERLIGDEANSIMVNLGKNTEGEL